MTLGSAYEGEDVPIQIGYVDDSGAAIAPDGAADSTGPTITITAPDDTESVSSTAMTEVETGTYEYVWDTAADSTTTSGETYHIEVTGEFSGETKLAMDNIKLF